MVGARYYAGGTWALVMMLRLYQRPNLSISTREGEGQVSRATGVREGLTNENTNTDANSRVLSFARSARLALALDGIEAEERVRAFWSVYALDRWFGVVCEVPCQSLAMDGSVGSGMTVPWPGVGGVVEVSVLRPVSHLILTFYLADEVERSPTYSQRSEPRLHARRPFGDACKGVSIAWRGNGDLSLVYR